MKPATDVCCPGCGRVYDAGLFDLGRSLQCACGTTVSPPLVERPGLADRPPRFMADAMLGRLARWLRLLGFDTAWEADIDDTDLVRRAAEERRIVLTRDRILVREWRVPAATSSWSRSHPPTRAAKSRAESPTSTPSCAAAPAATVSSGPAHTSPASTARSMRPASLSPRPRDTITFTRRP
ncbi:MAG: Mut7-C RNAse domain-containing protein [Planctomycetota bacterium]|jgi:hypothetical protein